MGWLYKVDIGRDYHFIIRMIKATMFIKLDVRFGSVYKEQTENLIDWMQRQLKTVLTDAALMELSVSSCIQYMEKVAGEISKCGALADLGES